MRQVTEDIIHDFKIMKLKYDFMGYEFKNKKELSFHHLFIPKCECKELGIMADGYLYWNGVILNQHTAHDYLHLIQRYDEDRFNDLTSEMYDQKIKGYLDIENLLYINDILKSFEKEYCGKREKGKLLIKEPYIKRKFN